MSTFSGRLKLLSPPPTDLARLYLWQIPSRPSSKWCQSKNKRLLIIVSQTKRLGRRISRHNVKKTNNNSNSNNNNNNNNNNSNNNSNSSSSSTKENLSVYSDLQPPSTNSRPMKSYSWVHIGICGFWAEAFLSKGVPTKSTSTI